MSVLSISGLSVCFGGLQALADVTLDVLEGETVGLIGPNGAGKTTLFNCVSGLQEPSTGSIRLSNQDVNRFPPHERAALGLGRTFQNVQLFGRLSALENVLIGAEQGGEQADFGVAGSMMRHGGERRRERFMRERAMAALDAVGAAEVADRVAGELPLGLARRVELARALAGLPDLLLLDEPASGLGSEESLEFAAMLAGIRSELGLAMLVVEHDVPMVLRISDRIYVLDFGRIIAHGPPAQVVSDPRVVAAYLGDAEIAV
jgi:branched-chain amino acid transport system ATP-binding protein